MTWKPHTLLLPLTFAGVWWLLTDGNPESWLVGMPAVLAASWMAQRLGTGERWAISTWGVLRFFPLFVWESLRGGADVVVRTLAPRMRIRPGFSTYHTNLKQRSARVFFANCVCLLPGTLAADLDEKELRIHMLDSGIEPQADLQRLEHAVARIYQQDTYTAETTAR